MEADGVSCTDAEPTLSEEELEEAEVTEQGLTQEEKTAAGGLKEIATTNVFASNVITPAGELKNLEITF